MIDLQTLDPRSIKLLLTLAARPDGLPIGELTSQCGVGGEKTVRAVCLSLMERNGLLERQERWGRTFWRMVGQLCWQANCLMWLEPAACAPMAGCDMTKSGMFAPTGNDGTLPADPCPEAARTEAPAARTEAPAAKDRKNFGEVRRKVKPGRKISGSSGKNDQNHQNLKAQPPKKLIKDLLNFKDLKDLLNHKDLKDLLNHKDLNDLLNLKDLKDLLKDEDLKDLSILDLFKNLKELYVLDHFMDFDDLNHWLEIKIIKVLKGLVLVTDQERSAKPVPSPFPLDFKKSGAIPLPSAAIALTLLGEKVRPKIGQPWAKIPGYTLPAPEIFSVFAPTAADPDPAPTLPRPPLFGPSSVNDPCEEENLRPIQPAPVPLLAKTNQPAENLRTLMPATLEEAGTRFPPGINQRLLLKANLLFGNSVLWKERFSGTPTGVVLGWLAQAYTGFQNGSLIHPWGLVYRGLNGQLSDPAPKACFLADPCRHLPVYYLEACGIPMPPGALTEKPFPPPSSAKTTPAAKPVRNTAAHAKSSTVGSKDSPAGATHTIPSGGNSRSPRGRIIDRSVRGQPHRKSTLVGKPKQTPVGACPMPTFEEGPPSAEEGWARALYWFKASLKPSLLPTRLQNQRLLGWSEDGERLRVSLPTPEEAEWCQVRLCQTLERSLHGIFNRPVRLEFVQG